MDWWASRREEYFKESHKEVHRNHPYLELELGIISKIVFNGNFLREIEKAKIILLYY